MGRIARGEKDERMHGLGLSYSDESGTRFVFVGSQHRMMLVVVLLFSTKSSPVLTKAAAADEVRGSLLRSRLWGAPAG